MFMTIIGWINKIFFIILKALIVAIVVYLMIRPVTFLLKCIWKMIVKIYLNIKKFVTKEKERLYKKKAEVK